MSGPGTAPYQFGNFQLDVQRRLLLRGGQAVSLTPKVFDTLLVLVENRDRVMGKDELIRLLWPGSFVEDRSLAVNISTLRKALGESAGEHRYIVTLPGQGYRFVADVHGTKPWSAEESGPPSGHFVGREPELEELRTAYRQLAAGRGSLVCVSGEPGLGKTTLVERFLSEISGATVTRGRCSESLAGSEAYLPVFEAVNDLLRAAGASSAVARTLKSVAPAWYLAVVISSSEDSSASPGSEAKTAISREGVKREIATFFEELCRIRPVILFLEDLHWADLSTIDLVGYLGHKCGSMRLLLVTTYRESELLAAKHPFRQVRLELQARNRVREISLEFLDAAALHRYVDLEFPGHAFPADFVKVIHTRTEGHPLFMADLLRDLRDRGFISRTNGQWILEGTVASIAGGLPASIQGMIERKVGLLSEEDRRLLSAAAVQGPEFDSSLLAETLEKEPDEVEERLGSLDQVHMLVRMVGEREFPNGAPGIRYRFVHSLYQNLFSELLPASRRVRFSLAIGNGLERCYGSAAGAPVSELARLFEQGRDFQRASSYYLSAARNAARVFAQQECILLAQRGIECLGRLPDSADRAACELSLQSLLGNSLMATRGFGESEGLAAFLRARELCRQYGLAGQATVAFGLGAFYLVRGEFPGALEMANEMSELARTSLDPVTRIQAHLAMGFLGLSKGHLKKSEAHFETAIAIPDPPVEPEAPIFWMHHSVVCRGQFGLLLWFLGYPDRAIRLCEEALARGEKHRSLFDICWSRMNLARVLELRGEVQEAFQDAETSIALGKEHGLRELSLWALLCHASCLCQLGRFVEGLAEIRTYLDTAAAIGSRRLRTNAVARLAECLAGLGRYEEGLASVNECIRTDVANGDRYYEPELYRLAGECHLGCGRDAEAEAAFRQALETARQMEARGWELRAAISLCRQLQKKGSWAESRQVLAPVYEWFTQGLETKDLREARLLLQSAPP